MQKQRSLGMNKCRIVVEVRVRPSLADIQWPLLAHWLGRQRIYLSISYSPGLPGECICVRFFYLLREKIVAKKEKWKKERNATRMERGETPRLLIDSSALLALIQRSNNFFCGWSRSLSLFHSLFVTLLVTLANFVVDFLIWSCQSEEEEKEE